MIVTLLTDYGRDDDFVGVCHGVIRAHLSRGPDRGHHARPAPLRGAPGRARAAQHAALHAAWACTWRWWTRRWAPSGAPWRCARATAASWSAPTTACCRWPGSAAAGSSWPWTSRARRTGSSRCRPPSTAATSSPRWPPTSRAARELADAGDPLDAAELAVVVLPEPRTEDGALVAHALVIDRYGNVGLDVGHDDTAGTGITLGGTVEIEAGGRALPGHLRPDLRRRAARRADRLRGRLPHARRGHQPRRRRAARSGCSPTPRCGCGRDDRPPARPPPPHRLDQRARARAGRARARRTARS